jgi:hypothetical protein
MSDLGTALDHLTGDTGKVVVPEEGAPQGEGGHGCGQVDGGWVRSARRWVLAWSRPGSKTLVTADATADPRHDQGPDLGAGAVEPQREMDHPGPPPWGGDRGL